MLSSSSMLKATVLLVVFIKSAFVASVDTSTALSPVVPTSLEIDVEHDVNTPCPKSCFKQTLKTGSPYCHPRDLVCLCQDQAAHDQVVTCVTTDCPTKKQKAEEIAMKLCGHTTSFADLAPRHEGHDHEDHHDHHDHYDHDHDHDGHNNASVEHDDVSSSSTTTATPALAPVQDAGAATGTHVACAVMTVGGIAAVLAVVM